jgi:hypothetical protein
MPNETNWTAKYFNDEAKARVEERKGLWSPELQERVARQWNGPVPRDRRGTE